MNAPLTSFGSTPADARRRHIEIEFLSERYHRGFDEEAAVIAALLAQAGDARLHALFEGTRIQLQHHEDLQEHHLFPAYQTFAAMSATLFQAWMDDSASLAESIHDVEGAARASGIRGALQHRVVHFASEMERHLVDEVELFASWAGTGGAQ